MLSKAEIEENTHYVLHVRVERVITTPNQGLKAATGPTKDRDVQEVINVVKKSDSLMNAVDFVKGVLDLAEKDNA